MRSLISLLDHPQLLDELPQYADDRLQLIRLELTEALQQSRLAICIGSVAAMGVILGLCMVALTGIVYFDLAASHPGMLLSAGLAILGGGLVGGCLTGKILANLRLAFACTRRELNHDWVSARNWWNDREA